MNGFESGRPPVAPMPVKPPKPRREPRPKRPMHANITDGLLVLLAAASLGLSGWSLATLLMEAGAPVWVACLGVGVFDLVALAAGLQVYARRSAPHTAGGARLVMMAALIASSVVNGAHGVALGGWTTAVVLAAAPLSFEVVFELRHRTLTALIWVLWRRQAWTALRRDAWERIAPVAAGPTVTVERQDVPPTVTIEREHQAHAVPADPAVAELAVLRAELAALKAERPAIEAEARPVTAEQDADEREREALALYRAVTSTPGATEADRAWAADAAIDAARQAPGVRPAEAPSLVKSAAPQAPASGGEPDDRVPDQRVPLSARVRNLRQAGITDATEMAVHLSALMDPPSLESVKRELRRQKAAERKAAGGDAGTGAYL
ncbi:hypothetical protein ABT224_41460 [Streptomyces sp. NPDC001584]|uniref:hypothetical protein n=1 Tax=Streptomyces sp. NPDC001584 TaxID=3154521 RepID=UPI00332159C4